MKNNLFIFWHWITLTPFFFTGIIFIIFLFLVFNAQSSLAEYADQLFGSISLKHINWKHFRYH